MVPNVPICNFGRGKSSADMKIVLMRDLLRMVLLFLV